MMSTTMVAAFAVAPVAGRVLGPGGVVAFSASVLAVGGVVGLVAVSAARPRTARAVVPAA